MFTALLGVGIAALFFRFGADFAQLLDLPLDRKHKNAIDRAIEAWFDRYVGITADKAAATAADTRARREEWWKATVPGLRSFFALALVVNICRVVFGHVYDNSIVIVPVLQACHVLGLGVCFATAEEAHFRTLHHAYTIAIPVLRFSFDAWPATGDACFRTLLANAVIFNTLVAEFTTPSASMFVGWHLAPTVIGALCSVGHVPALQAMSREQVGILCASACVAVVVHQYAQARLRKHLLLQEREPERPPVSDVSDSSDDADLH